MTNPLIILRRLFGNNKEDYDKWNSYQLMAGKDYGFAPYLIGIIFIVMSMIVQLIN